MNTVNFLIVEADEAYVNKVEVGGTEFYVNSTIESVENINRVMKVIEAPECTILQKGDEVIVHHNIMRKKLSTDGREVNSQFHIEGNMYYVPLREVFMYRRGDEDFKAIAPYTFVKPIKLEDEMQGGFIISSNESNSHKGMKKLTGVMSYVNEDLENQGVKNGDTVIFSPYSEYEFQIEGVIYYKMSTKDILAVL